MRAATVHVMFRVALAACVAVRSIFFRWFDAGMQ